MESRNMMKMVNPVQRLAPSRRQQSKANCVMPAAGLLALALLAGSASAQWSVTILSPENGNGYSRANCVFGNRQGGSIDDGYQTPLFWQGTFASQTELNYPPESGAEVTSITATQAGGSGYFRLSESEGFYTGILWDLSANTFSLINVPGAFESVINDISGNSQVGFAYLNDAFIPILWQGTSESWQSLLPVNYLGGECYGVDGNSQVGEVYDGDGYTAALWNGTAASFVSLHPLGWDDSYAQGVWGSQQVGAVYSYQNDSSVKHAAVWSGSAESFFDLHPPCAYRSEATAISMGRVVGNIRLDQESEEFAAYWPNSDSSEYVNLFDLLPAGQYLSAEANDIWTDGDGVVYIVGEAENVNFNAEAVMWTFTGGGCIVDGVQTIVPNAAACAGTYLGAGRYIGMATSCCEAPMDSSAAREDRDGDFLLDSCVTPAPQDDCNTNGIADALETLAFNSYFDQAKWSSNFVNNAAAIITPENTVVLTPALGGQIGTVISNYESTFQNSRMTAVFDFSVDQTVGFPGDGFSFAILDSLVHSTDAVFGEDGPAFSSFAVKFNTYENDPGEGSNSMELRYGGYVILRHIDLPFALVGETWHRAIINLSVDGIVTVKLANDQGDVATVFDQVQIPDYVPFQSVYTGFGARTGAAINRHRIRNFHIGFSNELDANADGLPDSCSGPACFADYNQDGGIDGSDIEAFFTDWEAGSSSADTNQDGGIDGSDVEIFFTQWEAGGC